MDDLQIKFWYPTRINKQLSFSSKPLEVPYVCSEGHILMGGNPLCGYTLPTPNKKEGENRRLLEAALPNIPLCKKCQEIYKNNPRSAWSKWVNR